MENNPVITNAEWIILRILLNKSPLGSRDILASVQKSNQWSSATVKTFLARLVLKKAISYHKDKNAFLYYPLVTEMMYVRNETKSFFAKIYGGTITYESNHFQFFGSDSLAFVINLANALEANYSRISADFAYQQTQKQMVYIHSSLKVMHSALGYENGPDWMTAGWFWEILHVAPEATFKNFPPETSVSHVFTQLIMHYLNPYAPFWLVQGMAVYESGWLTHERIKEAMVLKKDQLDTYLVLRIPTEYQAFYQQNGYEIACTVILFIENKYGKDRLLAFLKSPESLRNIFGCSETLFWTSWVEFVRRTYFDEMM